jgi:hypothetical protein
MKKLFKQDDNSAILIAGLAIGASAAGAIGYLYFKRNARLRAEAREIKEHAKDYLKAKTGKKQKHKTDVDELKPIAANAPI